MVSMRRQSAEDSRETFDYPAARFVTDFTRLITDVDRLMVDIRTAAEQENIPGKTNGRLRKPSLNDTISTLRDHARVFVKSLRHYGVLHDRVPIPYLELDGKARILKTNEECAEMLNGAATPLLGRSLFGFVADSDIKRLRERLAASRQTDKPCAVHVSIVHKGKHFPVEFRIRRQFVGDEIGYLAVIETADHSAEARGPSAMGKDGAISLHELVVSLSRAYTLRSVADIVGNYCRKAFGSPAGMIFVEHDGDLQMVSKWRSRHIPKKYLAEEMIRKGPVASAFRTGKPIFWSRRRKAPSNISRYLRDLLSQCRRRNVAFLPIRGSEQRPLGVLTIVLPAQDEVAPEARDEMLRLAQIASGCIVRARAYDEALDARARAEHAFQRKEEFFSVLSHELKNPMMPILGWAVALGSGTLPAEKQNLAIEGIIRNVRALNYLIDDLFDAARISSGKLRLELAEMRIQEVAREALSAIQHTAEGKKLRISTDISEAIPPFFADSRRVRQVLMNLLNNAVKFTPEGGSIALKIVRRGGVVQCTVSDTGKGIEPRFLPYVFDAYRQENRSTRSRSAGLGLGLAIVREIVILHGGTIKAHSSGADQGATFILRLPISRRRPVSSPQVHSQSL